MSATSTLHDRRTTRAGSQHPALSRAAAPSAVHRKRYRILPVVKQADRVEKSNQALIPNFTSGQDVAEHPHDEALAGWVDRSGSLARLNRFEMPQGILHRAGHRPAGVRIQGRSTRPPLDAFSSWSSLGYSLLYKNIAGAIRRHSRAAYIGFLHPGFTGATLVKRLKKQTKTRCA